MFLSWCSPLPGFYTVIARGPHTAPTENVNMCVVFILPNAGKKYASPTRVSLCRQPPLCLPLTWYGQAHSIVCP